MNTFEEGRFCSDTSKLKRNPLCLRCLALMRLIRWVVTQNTTPCSTGTLHDSRATGDPLYAQKEIFRLFLDIKLNMSKTTIMFVHILSRKHRVAFISLHGWWWERGNVAKGWRWTCGDSEALCHVYKGIIASVSQASLRKSSACSVPLSPSHSQIAFPPPHPPVPSSPRPPFLHGHGAVGRLKQGWWRKRWLRRGQG